MVMSQMKEQDKSSEKQLNEVDLDNLPESEFRVMILKMIQDLRINMEMAHEMFTKGLEEPQNKQIKMNNTLND